MSDLRAVVFDYGHTLIDFSLAEERLLDCYVEIRAMLEAEAYRDLPEAPQLVEALTRGATAAVEESYRNRQLEELDIVALFDAGLRSLGVELPRDMVRSIAQMEHRAMAARLVAPEEHLTVLRTLRERGLRIGLVSNAHFLPELMREDIDRLGIAHYVDDAVFSAEIGVRKPHPAIFLKVLNELGIKPTEAVFVGDRLRDDVGGAQALGMRAILTQQFRQEQVTDDTSQPDAVIQTLPELIRYLDSLTS